MCETEELLKRIEFLRNKMTEVAFTKGFTSKDSIIISQELDKLLNLYDSVRSENIKKVNSIFHITNFYGIYPVTYLFGEIPYNVSGPTVYILPK